MKKQKRSFKIGHVAVLFLLFLLVLGNIHTYVVHADPPVQIEGEWVQSSNGRWWYRHWDGSYTTNAWEYINSNWYHFDTDGWMQTGWLQVNSTWYYLGDNGAMCTGWQYINNYWYYFSSSGSMCTGWVKVNNLWYYFNSSGTMCVGWKFIDNYWYYFNSSGDMRTDDLYTALRIYSFDNSGHWVSTALRVVRQQQQKSKWCWVASAVMVGKFNTNSTKNQSEVVYHIRHNYDNEPGEDWEANYALYYASDYTKIGTITAIDDFPYSSAVANIDADKPFMVKMLKSSGGAHMVVGAGYRPYDGAIKIIDPASNCSNCFYSYTDLINGTTIQSGYGRWITTICY